MPAGARWYWGLAVSAGASFAVAYALWMVPPVTGDDLVSLGRVQEGSVVTAILRLRNNTGHDVRVRVAVPCGWIANQESFVLSPFSSKGVKLLIDDYAQLGTLEGKVDFYTNDSERSSWSTLIRGSIYRTVEASPPYVTLPRFTTDRVMEVRFHLHRIDGGIGSISSIESDVVQGPKSQRQADGHYLITGTVHGTRNPGDYRGSVRVKFSDTPTATKLIPVDFTVAPHYIVDPRMCLLPDSSTTIRATVSGPNAASISLQDKPDSIVVDFQKESHDRIVIVIRSLLRKGSRKYLAGHIVLASKDVRQPLIDIPIYAVNSDVD